MRTRMLFLASLLVTTPVVSAQAPVASPSAVTRQIAHVTAGVVEELFVDIPQGRAVAADLRHKADTGEFDRLAPGPEFAAALTDTMQRVENDKHLNLRFKAGDQSPVLTVAQALERFRANQGGTGISPFGTPEDQRRANYDVKTARHLTGNVGYLELTAFQSAPEARDVITAAMRMLENVDAMMIEVRGNRGGSQQTVNPDERQELLGGRSVPVHPAAVRSRNDRGRNDGRRRPAQCVRRPRGRVRVVGVGRRS